MPADVLPTISVVVPTKGRPAETLRLLRSLRAQRTLPLEVIVVDQSLPAYVLEPFAQLVHLHEPELTGLTAARNRGVDAARGDVVLFFDDDAFLESDCVREIALAFAARPALVGAQCAIRNPDYDTRLRLFQISERIFRHGFFSPFPKRRAGEVIPRLIDGVASAYRRELLECERFDEALPGYGLGEDWDMTKRARRHGDVTIVPGARVLHEQSQVNRNDRVTNARLRRTNYLYLYDKLGAARDPRNRLWKQWFLCGEGLRRVKYAVTREARAPAPSGFFRERNLIVLRGRLVKRIRRFLPAKAGELGRLWVETPGGSARRLSFRPRTSDEIVIREIFRDGAYALDRLGRWPELRASLARSHNAGRRPLIVDAGANIGASAVFFALTFPTAHVIALEPEEQNFKLLVENTRGLNVTCLQAALSCEAGRVQVLDPGEGPWAFRTERLTAGDGPACTTVGTLYGEYVGRHTFPFLVKIDIEGGEADVFARNTAWVHTTPLVVAELHDWMLPGKGSALPFLRCVGALNRDFVYFGENVFSIDNADAVSDACAPSAGARNGEVEREARPENYAW